MAIEVESTLAPDGHYRPPSPVPVDPGVPLPPDGLGYRFKRKVLGPPLHSEEIEEQRLGKPTALAVFASDNLSSSAYATEEILHVLIPLVGLAAFSLVVPITLAMVVVLGFLILSYRETIKEYPSAGGAYVVTRDNFGVVPAQVAGASLLTDYILTVAVSAAAGTAALVSAVGALAPYTVPIACFFIALVAYGNLRGVKESGKVFAVPTYFFIFNMALLLGIGLWKYVGGDLPVVGLLAEEAKEIDLREGLFYGAGIWGGAPRLCLRRRGGHRGRGHLERCARVPEASMEERAPDARHHGHRPRDHVPRAVGPRRPDQGGAVADRHAHGDRPGRRGGVRRRHARQHPLLLAAARHDAHPDHGGQHGLRRLPPPGQLPGRRHRPRPTCAARPRTRQAPSTWVAWPWR